MPLTFIHKNQGQVPPPKAEVPAKTIAKGKKTVAKPDAQPYMELANAIMHPEAAHQPAIVPKAMSDLELRLTEYLLLHQKLEEVGGKQLIARMDQLRKELQSIANDQFSDEEKAVLVCDDGELEFGPRTSADAVADPLPLVQHLIEKYGTEVAFSCVKIGITELKKIMSELELQPFVQKKPGSRTVKAVRPKKESAGG